MQMQKIKRKIILRSSINATHEVTRADGPAALRIRRKTNMDFGINMLCPGQYAGITSNEINTVIQSTVNVNVPPMRRYKNRQSSLGQLKHKSQQV